MYNSAENTEFWASSNVNSFANFGPLMTNDGELESRHQGEFVFGCLAGGRNNYKNNNLVQGKQTMQNAPSKIYISKNNCKHFLGVKLCNKSHKAQSVWFQAPIKHLNTLQSGQNRSQLGPFWENF